MTSYTVEKHFRGTSALVTDLARSIQAFVLGLDSVIKEVPGKNYIAYKLSKIIIYMTVQKKRVRLCLNLDPEELLDAPKELNPRVVANWGRARFSFVYREPRRSRASEAVADTGVSKD